MLSSKGIRMSNPGSISRVGIFLAKSLANLYACYLVDVRVKILDSIVLFHKSLLKRWLAVWKTIARKVIIASNSRSVEIQLLTLNEFEQLLPSFMQVIDWLPTRILVG